MCIRVLSNHFSSVLFARSLDLRGLLPVQGVPAGGVFSLPGYCAHTSRVLLKKVVRPPAV